MNSCATSAINVVGPRPISLRRWDAIQKLLVDGRAVIAFPVHTIARPSAKYLARMRKSLDCWVRSRGIVRWGKRAGTEDKHKAPTYPLHRPLSLRQAPWMLHQSDLKRRLK